MTSIDRHDQITLAGRQRLLDGLDWNDPGLRGLGIEIDHQAMPLPVGRRQQEALGLGIGMQVEDHAQIPALATGTHVAHQAIGHAVR